MLNTMMQAQPENIRTVDKKGTVPLEKLAEKAARGDRDALYDLCEKIARDVLFRATHIMGNRTDAEDATQEILIRVCEKIRDLRDPKAFGVWLSKIIANETKRHMVENSKRGVVLDIDDYLESIMEENDDFLPQECSENEESREALMEIIAGLPMRQRAAVIFHYYDGLNVTQTAEAMSVPKQDVSKYIALAREKIRRELEKQQIGTVSLSAAAALPMTSLLTEGLRHEAGSFVPATEAWVRKAVVQCKEYILANPPSAATVSAAPKDPFGLMMCAAATLVTLTTIILGITLGGAPRQVSSGIGEIPQITISGKILFSGGISNGGNTVYVNPEHAAPSASSTGGEVTALHWWISAAGNEAILYEGDADNLDDTLIHMRKNGVNGEYRLFFKLEDEAGATHTLGSNFYIL